ncbi:MAG: hypothetical protein ALAOOOJD_04539 [bacterium]|nr:hypothetical protein [bacterium]
MRCIRPSGLFSFCGLFPQIIIITSRKAAQFPVLYFDDAIRNRIDKSAVVGNKNQRAVVIGQRVFEHLPRQNVEMVRRLVHHQQISRPRKHFGQGDAGLFAARKHRNWLENVVAGKKKRAEHRSPLLRRKVRRHRRQLFHDRRVRIQNFELMLGIIIHRHVMAVLHRAALHFHRAGNDFD